MSKQTRLNRVTRRKFTALLSASGTAIPALATQQATQSDAGPPVPPQTRPAPGNFRRPLAPDTPPFEGALVFSRKDVACKAEPFPMKQVRLLPGNMYYNAQEWNRGYMSRLAADRLLYTFRQNAGLPVGAAKSLGGWEQPDNGQRSSELRGHFCGHFLSASAQLAANGDTQAKAKADYMVAELAKCQEKLGGKYLSAFPTYSRAKELAQ